MQGMQWRGHRSNDSPDGDRSCSANPEDLPTLWRKGERCSSCTDLSEVREHCVSRNLVLVFESCYEF